MAWSDLLPPAWTSAQPQSPLRQPFSEVLLAVGLIVILGTCGRMLFSGRRKMDVRGKHVYITGGSSGLGLALAKHMARQGADVTIVARDRKKLEEARVELERLRSDSSLVIQAISADLTTLKTSRQALADAIADPKFKGKAPDHVYLCAGFAKPGFFVTTSERDLQQGLDGVYWVSAWTAQAAARMMVEQNARGSKIVIVSSFMGLTGFAGYSPYAPAKYALRGLAECLRSEFLLYGIDVHLYLPAGILSPGLETENAFKPAITRKIEEGDTPITPEQCVEVLIKGLECGQFQICNDLVTNIMRAGGKAAAPGNGVMMDAVYGVMAWIGIPIWRRQCDAQIRAHADEHRREVVDGLRREGER